MNDRKLGSTQIERVVTLLRRRAADGLPLNTVDFLSPTADGLNPILRLPARIHDLRNFGYRIETKRTANGTADYYLMGERRLTAAVNPTQPSEPARLFPIGHPASHDRFARLTRRGAV